MTYGQLKKLLIPTYNLGKDTVKDVVGIPTYDIWATEETRAAQGRQGV